MTETSVDKLVLLLRFIFILLLNLNILWSSPVAIGQTINDLLGTTAMAARFLIEEDFTEEYTTGRYKGMNKFEVMAIRNIPVIRSINRVLDLPNNNSYYKLDENILSIILYKDIAKDIFE